MSFVFQRYLLPEACSHFSEEILLFLDNIFAYFGAKSELSSLMVTLYLHQSSVTIALFWTRPGLALKECWSIRQNTAISTSMGFLVRQNPS